MKILVTSSTGLTGKAVVEALSCAGHEVRAMIHSRSRAEEMIASGAGETYTGDIASADDLRDAMKGVDAVYYICPTAREDEAELGRLAITIAAEQGVGRFMYQSVLHSVEPSLPHHRQKLEVERALIDSGIAYTIVQPAPFMQNILNSRDRLLSEGVFAQKFFTDTSASNRINLLDARDLGEAVAAIIDNPVTRYATLELCGPHNLSAQDILSALADVIGKEVVLTFITDDTIAAGMKQRGASQYSIDTLLTMFRHYNEGDFCGSPVVAERLLGHYPASFNEFLKREL